MRLVTEEGFLLKKYRGMASRVKHNTSYSEVGNKYKGAKDFINYWMGKTDWWDNPELDRISSDGHYSKKNTQFLSKEEHLTKTSKERAKLSDKEALKVLYSKESTWKIAKRIGENQNQYSESNQGNLIVGCCAMRK
jgi:hypothetical protein